jgi:hypothetical protein
MHAHPTTPTFGICFCLLFSLVVPSPLSALDVVRQGQPLVTIVIPDEPLPVHKAAAEELQYHVRRASGAELTLIPESQAKTSTSNVYLGPCRRTLTLGLWPHQTKPNGYVIRVAGGDLFICGDDSNGAVFGMQHTNRTRVGTLFGVYEVLERNLKVRWLWPGELGTDVPRSRNIAIANWDAVGAPPLIHSRWVDYGGVSGLDGWSSNEVRERFIDEQGKWLRRHRFALGVAMDMAHAFTYWWEPKGKDHPEYFNQLPDGTRRPDPTFYSGDPKLISMSVGEPALWSAIVAHWRKTRTPGAPYIDATENDTNGKCVCDKCLAMDVPDPLCPTPFTERVAKCRDAFAKGQTGWESHLGSLSDRYARYYLAVQKEAAEVDPQATVMGYAYASTIRPPMQTNLNKRIIVGIVPAFYFPWTNEKRKAARQQWDGWAATGVSMFLRPNYMLDGHNMPIFFARALGEDFAYCAAHGLVGTTFDSLTGQYATQGPNLYMLARLHDNPKAPVQQVLDEYYAGFGPAQDAVRRYFGLWEQVSAGITEEVCAKITTHWVNFYRDADVVFTPEVMDKAWSILRKAKKDAQKVPEALERVEFLENGLRNVALTMDTQKAHRAFVKDRDLDRYRAALERLDTYRASIENDLVSNLAYLNWAEDFTWGRRTVKRMKEHHTKLPDEWQFAWDPNRQGEIERWLARDLESRHWLKITSNGTWNTQDVGKAWKAEHGADYTGVAWYRQKFAVTANAKAVWVVFGAVATACKIWVNGEMVLHRPHPIWGSPDAWMQPFEVDISKAVRPGQPNTIAVRVDSANGAGGIWQPVWVVYCPVTVHTLGCLSDKPESVTGFRSKR